jgi:alanine or glycine:cation symporter, AGCS family
MWQRHRNIISIVKDIDMDMNWLSDQVDIINGFLWGWPLVIFILASSVVMTVALRFVQFRYFAQTWKSLVTPPAATAHKAEMSSLSAFLNALSASLGNGSIAGMATALAAGGPGAAFWVFVLGFLSMSFRFCEVYLAVRYPAPAGSAVLGGPMIYLSKVPGGKWLPSVYAFFCMMLGFVIGCNMQANSIGLALHRSMALDARVVAVLVFFFVLYVVYGGAKRIIAVSDAIVPVKVGLFFIGMLIALAYHYASIIPALQLIISSAFSMNALSGAAAGYTMQQAIRFGFSRVSNASEAGLGTAGIFFGATGGKSPVNEGVFGMLSTFISANLVCFTTMLLIVASGVWNNGMTSTPLTSAAFETVFGVAGGYLVSLLSLMFGLGVMVAYAYVTRSCWLYLTGGKYITAFNLIYCLAAFVGPLTSVKIIWNSADIINAGLLISNLFGMLWLLPTIASELRHHERA